MLLTQPVMVGIVQNVGSFGAFHDGIEIYGRATASADRRLVSLEDASHYDLHDRPEATGPPLEKAIPFLNLGIGQGVVGAIKRVTVEAMS